MQHALMHALCPDACTLSFTPTQHTCMQLTLSVGAHSHACSSNHSLSFSLSLSLILSLSAALSDSLPLCHGQKSTRQQQHSTPATLIFFSHRKPRSSFAHCSSSLHRANQQLLFLSHPSQAQQRRQASSWKPPPAAALSSVLPSQ